MTLPIALVVHGHFYQPPRENPWTDEIAREPSAAPFHDWNARIHAECYRSNAFARIHDAAGRIESIVDNYSRMSFNFGPTLARWLERHAPRTHVRLQAADQDQRLRLGHGGAIAQAYAHPIVPLSTPRDRQTQLLWGLLDFRNRFGRDAEGLWLPETAVDPATLETLIELGVQFTILAPEQIAAVRAPGGEWAAVTRDTVDTGRAYRWLHRDGSGRSIAIVVFDGPTSRAVAFGDAITRAERFLDQVVASARRSSGAGRRLVLCASDGELFGHHRKFADLTLAFATHIDAARRGIEVTNISGYLASDPPTWEARLAVGPHEGEGTAWSCAHGLGRWERDCGCSMAGPALGWNQKWRTPLRRGLDLVRDHAAALYEDAAAELVVDPWGLRDAYGAVVDAPIPARDRLIGAFGRRALVAGGERARRRVRLLLELERATLLMYASCGWFFDDIAGHESALVLRMAAHAMDLFERAGGAPPRDQVAEVLAEAKSNRKDGGTGADVLRKVSADRVTSADAVAFVALGALMAGEQAPAAGPRGFDVRVLRRREESGAAGPVLSGRALAVDRRTGVAEELGFVASPSRVGRFTCKVTSETGESRTVSLDALSPELRDELVVLALPRIEEQVDDVHLVRLALDAFRAAPGEDPGPPWRKTFARMLIRLLSREDAIALDPEKLALAIDLYDAAEMEPGSIDRRVVEEHVWAMVSSKRAIHPDLARLAKRLGFAPNVTAVEGAGG